MPSQISVFALATRTATALLACHLAAFFLALAGCSQFGKPEETPEPNVYPTNYKKDLLAYLREKSDVLVNASATYISTPALKQFGSESRYFVCLRIDGQNGRKEKFVVFYAGLINQFVDATSEQCGAAAYQSFPEALRRLAVGWTCPTDDSLTQDRAKHSNIDKVPQVTNDWRNAIIGELTQLRAQPPYPHNDDVLRADGPLKGAAT